MNVREFERYRHKAGGAVCAERKQITKMQKMSTDVSGPDVDMHLIFQIDRVMSIEMTDSHSCRLITFVIFTYD